MKRLRNLVGILLAFSFAAFALPALAIKQVRIDSCANGPSGPVPCAAPAPATVGPNTITLYYKNVGDDSSFNSLTIDVTAPTGYTVAINTAKAPAPKVGDPIGTGTANVTLTNLAPVKVGKEVPITVTYTLTASATGSSCPSPLAFNGTAWTGSQSTTSNFDNVGQPVQVGILTASPAYACTFDTITTCADENPLAGYTFNASLPGATTFFDTGYGAGFQMTGGKACPILTFAALNYLSGINAGTKVDALGRILPPNSFSMVVTSSTTGFFALSYTLTFGPQKSGTNGEPDPLKPVKYCTLTGPGDCTAPGNQLPLQSCQGPQIDASALPGTEPACKTGESYTQTARGDCSISDAEWNSGVRCLINSVTVTDVKDPPIIR